MPWFEKLRTTQLLMKRFAATLSAIPVPPEIDSL
jgi:hypothetical protein